jgi:hypothetical protein
MRQRLRSHLTYANVISTLALFIVLGGTAYAVDGPLAGQNTVGSEDIINTEVKTADLGADSVASGKIADSQVKSADVLNDNLTATDLASGSVAGAEVQDGSVANADVAPNSLASSRILDGTLTGVDVADNSLKGADIDESTLAIGPGSGDFVQGRGTLLSNRIVLAPDTDKTLLVIPGLGELRAACIFDRGMVSWVNTTSSTIDRWWEHNGSWLAGLNGPDTQVVVADSADNAGGTLALGLGNDPGARRIATLDAFAFQSGMNAPCGFQTQGTLWTSG